MANIDFSLVDQLASKTAEEVNKMAPMHILVIGKTGVGKSTLINQIFREKMAATGIGQPITAHIQQIQKAGVPLVLYDTRGLELNPAVQTQIKREIAQTLALMKKNGKTMHCAYYCLNANSARIESIESDLIRELARQMPVFIVLTQSIGEPAVNFRQYIADLDLPVVGVHNVLAEDYRIMADIVIEAYGLQSLISETFAILPPEIHAAFNNAQQVDIQRKAKAARSWARRYIISTFSVGFSPIPFADAAVLVPMQIGMLAHITAIFGASLERQKLLGVIGAIGGTGGATYLGRSIVSNIAKFLPGVGSVAGGLISGATAAILTSALALSYIEVLVISAEQEAKGTVLSAESISLLMKERLRRRLEKGQEDPDYQALWADRDQADAPDFAAAGSAQPERWGKIVAKYRHKFSGKKK